MILTQKKNSFEFFFKRLNRLAERMGFEPMCPCGQTVFKTPRYDHFDTSPYSVFAVHLNQRKTYITIPGSLCQ